MSPVSVDFMLVILVLGLSAIAARASYWVLKAFAGFTWWGLGIYWIYNPFTTAGSPPHIIILLVMLFGGIAMMLFPFWITSRTETGEERGRLRLPFVPSEDEEQRARYTPTRKERNAAYRERLNRPR